MLEIIVLICAVIALIYTPIEAKKVHGGWVRPKFKGTPEEFRAKYIKQLRVCPGWDSFLARSIYCLA